MRRKESLILLIIILGIACVVSNSITYGLTKAKYEAQMISLAENSLSASVDAFRSCKEEGHIEDYWFGVTSFKQYVELANCIHHVPMYPRAASYTEGNAIFGLLVLDPERGESNVSNIIDALSVIRGNITALDVHLRLAELKNILLQGENSHV